MRIEITGILSKMGVLRPSKIMYPASRVRRTDTMQRPGSASTEARLC